MNSTEWSKAPGFSKKSQCPLADDGGHAQQRMRQQQRRLKSKGIRGKVAS